MRILAWSLADGGRDRPEALPDPAHHGYFLGIHQLVGEGHDQFVDDAFTSRNGRLVFVSRPSPADVVAISLRDGRIVWRVKIEGCRADHMAISPNGRRLLVSASTARKVHVIDTAGGAIVGEFASGDQPHENNCSHDGKLIYHASRSTNSGDGKRCFVSVSGNDRVSVITYRAGKEAARIPVGDRPQRMRMGVIRRSFVR